VAGRLDRVEVVLGAAEAHVPGVAVLHAAGHGGVGSVGAQLGAEPVQPVAHKPDVQQPGHLSGVPRAAVRPLERRQVQGAQGRPGTGHVAADRRVRAGPRGGEDQTAAAAGPRTVLPEHVERVRHGQADAVRRGVPVLGAGRRPGRLGVRRPGPQVLALGRPAAGGRGPVHRGHRDGVPAAAVPVPAQLLHRAHAGVPGQGAARLRQVCHVPGHHHGGVHVRPGHLLLVLRGHGAQGPGDGRDRPAGRLVRHRAGHVQDPVLGHILHDVAGSAQRGGRQRGPPARGRRRRRWRAGGRGNAVAPVHATGGIRTVRRVRGAHGGRHDEHAHRRHVGHFPGRHRERRVRVAVRPDQGVRQLHVAGRHAAAVQPVAHHGTVVLRQAVRVQVVAGLRPLGRRRRLRSRLGLGQPVNGHRPRVPRTHGRNHQAVFHDAQTTCRTLNNAAAAVLAILVILFVLRCTFVAVFSLILLPPSDTFAFMNPSQPVLSSSLHILFHCRL